MAPIMEIIRAFRNDIIGTSQGTSIGSFFSSALPSPWGSARRMIVVVGKGLTLPNHTVLEVFPREAPNLDQVTTNGSDAMSRRRQER